MYRHFCVIRSDDVQAEPERCGAGDAAVLAGVAELATETRRTRIHRAHQRGKVGTSNML